MGIKEQIIIEFNVQNIDLKGFRLSLHYYRSRFGNHFFFTQFVTFFAFNWSPPEFRIGLRPFCVVESWEVIGETCGADDDDDVGDVVGDDDDDDEFW